MVGVEWGGRTEAYLTIFRVYFSVLFVRAVIIISL